MWVGERLGGSAVGRGETGSSTKAYQIDAILSETPVSTLLFNCKYMSPTNSPMKAYWLVSLIK